MGKWQTACAALIVAAALVPAVRAMLPPAPVATPVAPRPADDRGARAALRDLLAEAAAASQLLQPLPGEAGTAARVAVPAVLAWPAAGGARLAPGPGWLIDEGSRPTAPGLAWVILRRMPGVTPHPPRALLQPSGTPPPAPSADAAPPAEAAAAARALYLSGACLHPDDPIALDAARDGLAHDLPAADPARHLLELQLDALAEPRAPARTAALLTALHDRLRAAPDGWLAWHQLGWAMARLHRPDLARTALVRALSLWPRSPWSWWELATLDAARRDVARAHGRRALALLDDAATAAQRAELAAVIR